MSPAWRTRFVHDIAQYLFSYYLESLVRFKAVPPDMEHVLEIRRDTIATRPTITAGEAACGSELAFPIILSEPFHRLRIICADAVAVQNDAYGLFRDLGRTELNQAVVLIRHHEYTPEQALHHLEQSHDELIGQYQQLEQRALTQAERYGLPEEKLNVEGYLSTMRSLLSGNDAWSRETARYNDHVPSSWTWTTA